MARLYLTMALERRKHKGEPHTKTFYRKDGQWHLIKRGPGYENHYRVEEYSKEEEDYMRMKEVKYG